MRRKDEMFGYQQRAVTAFYEHDGIIAVMPMGAGKTVAAATAAREMIDDGVISHCWVLAPKRVAQLVWPPELREWEHLADMTPARLTGGPAARASVFETGFAVDLPEMSIIHHDVIDWWVEQMAAVPDDHPYWDLLIIDEISRFRNPKSKRGKQLLKIIKRFRNVWGLTGTPRPNGFEDLFKPAQIVTAGKPQELWGRSFYTWRDQRFFPLDYNRHNWSIRMEWRDRTIREFQSISFTVDPGDMPELPEINIRETVVSLPEDVMREYKRMEKLLFSQFRTEFAQALDKSDSVTIAAGNKGIATGKLAQMAQGFMYDENKAVVHLHSAKGDWLLDVIDSMGGAPLLISYEFHEDLAVLRELLGGDLPYFGEGVSDTNALRWEAQWNARELPFLALHPASAGHGLNLQHGGNQLAAYGMTWSAEYWDQLLKRFHRTGQKERCFVHTCIARDTVDEMKRDRVVGKMTAQQAFNSYLRRV